MLDLGTVVAVAIGGMFVAVVATTNVADVPEWRGKRVMTECKSAVIGGCGGKSYSPVEWMVPPER